MQAYGLYTHIRANRIKSILLLAGFVVLLHAVFFSFLVIGEAMRGGEASQIWRDSLAWSAQLWPYAFAATGLWFMFAWFRHQAMVRGATGAVAVERSTAPQLYRALENLCISRGIPMPRLEIIETDSLNAYAAGLRDGDYCIAVTRGLMEQLTPDELEAVLAHELTHIRNRDTQLMVVALIFAGLFGFLAEVMLRGGLRAGSGSRRSNSGSGGGAALIILVAVAVVLLSWGLSVMVRFALSRKREYLADAGAVELTKNPDAMISALRKIERNSVIRNMPTHLSAFFIDSPLRRVKSGAWFSTHPTMDDRVTALIRFAGGTDVPPPPLAPATGPAATENAADPAGGAPPSGT